MSYKIVVQGLPEKKSSWLRIYWFRMPCSRWREIVMRECDSQTIHLIIWSSKKGRWEGSEASCAWPHLWGTVQSNILAEGENSKIRFCKDDVESPKSTLVCWMSDIPGMMPLWCDVNELRGMSWKPNEYAVWKWGMSRRIFAKAIWNFFFLTCPGFSPLFNKGEKSVLTNSAKCTESTSCVLGKDAICKASCLA